MDVERGRTVKGWRPRRLGERVLLWRAWGPAGFLSLFFPPLLLFVFSSQHGC